MCTSILPRTIYRRHSALWLDAASTRGLVSYNSILRFLDHGGRVWLPGLPGSQASIIHHTVLHENGNRTRCVVCQQLISRSAVLLQAEGPKRTRSDSRAKLIASYNDLWSLSKTYQGDSHNAANKAPSSNVNPPMNGTASFGSSSDCSSDGVFGRYPPGPSTIGA